MMDSHNLLMCVIPPFPGKFSPKTVTVLLFLQASSAPLPLPKSLLSRVQAMSEEHYGLLSSSSHSGGEPFVSSSAAAAAAHLVNARGMEEAVVKVGGFGPHGVTNQVRDNMGPRLCEIPPRTVQGDGSRAT